MNNRAVALVFGLLVVLVLSILSASFYFSAINENNLVIRHVESIRAFWLAEAGIAQAVNNLPSLTTSGSCPSGNSRYTYSTLANQTAPGLYNIVSTGSVALSSGVITRALSADVKTGNITGTNFKYAIETTTDLVIKGSVTINPSDSKKGFSTLDFTALFGSTKVDIRSNATHLYTVANFTEPVDGITWVDVPPGDTLTVAGNLNGSGILIVSGDAHFSGTVNFNGIIYVIGELTITGTVIINGSVLAESETTVDTTIKGNVTLNYDLTQIELALDNVEVLTKDIVSWKEM